MCHYLTSRHFGTNQFETEPGFSKFYGPWLLYVNSGGDDDMLADVANQTQIEKEQWPYAWVEDAEYPIKRGSVQGSITGQLRAMTILYDSFDEKFDVQTKGYLYYNESNEKGDFELHNVRPGDYILVVYPVAGQGSENIVMQNVSVASEGQ